MSVNLLLIFFVLVVVAMIAFILVQKGTGATAGSAFGSGASNTVFGAQGSGNFLTKTTMMLAFLFFAISMFMAVQASKDFTTATTGEIDLGVVGKLDSSDSDVPEISTVESAEKNADDVPNLEEAIKDEATAIKEAVTDKATEVKGDVVEKAVEVKEAAEDNAVEVIDPVDG